jgi:hypothetical protein
MDVLIAGAISMLLEAEALHPFISVTVTEKVVGVLGETMMLDDVAPVLHENTVPPDAVSVAFVPMQMVMLTGEIFAVGSGFTFTVLEAEAVQPLASVTVTE